MFNFVSVLVSLIAAAPITDLAHWQQQPRHQQQPQQQRTAADFQWKSADGWLLNGSSVERRDSAGPVAWHVLADRRTRRVPIANDQDGDIRKSAYVCEDGSLVLSCTAGKHIDVLRANFGRFSITLCNPSGFLDWSVNCASGNSLPVLSQRFVSYICLSLSLSLCLVYLLYLQYKYAYTLS